MPLVTANPSRRRRQTYGRHTIDMLHSSMINEGDINNRGTVAGEMGDALLAVDLGVSLDACSVGGRGQGLMPYRMQKNMIVASLRLSGLCHCNVWVHDCV